MSSGTKCTAGAASERHDRQIVAQTLLALFHGTGRHADAALRAAVTTFLADPGRASSASFNQVSHAAIRRWYDRAAHPNQAERLALWRRVRKAMGRQPGRDPGGWNGDSSVLALARLADEASLERREAPPRETLDEPASAGAEPPDEPVFGGPRPGLPAPAQPAQLPPPAPVEPPQTQPLRTPPKIDFMLPPRVPERGEVFSRDLPSDRPAAPPIREQAPTPRWIQGNAWRPDAAAAPARSLAPMRWNLLAIHIGPSSVVRHDAPVPVGGLDFSGGEVALSLQLELAGALVAALVPASGALRPSALSNDPAIVVGLMAGPLAQRKVDPVDAAAAGSFIELASTPLSLPRAGDSTVALFAVCPLPGCAKAAGRIAVIHKSRVLQTARVSVTVCADASQGDGALVYAETIHPRDDDLDRRTGYDVAIQVSDVGGKLHLVVQHGDTPTPVQLADLAEPIDRLCGALGRMAAEWDYTKTPLEQAVFGECLFSLAANGAEIERHLRKHCGDGIDRWQRIHLVPVTSQFFPLEYVYDGPPPKPKKSKPCPNLFAAMEAGSCDVALVSNRAPAACPNQQDSTIICPMHFWGFRRVIERNGTMRAQEDTVAATGVRKTTVAVPSRQPYGKVRAALLGATDRAFLYLEDPAARAGARAKLLAGLRALFGTDEAKDWDDWRAKVKGHPNLLVLLVHTDEYQGARVLEIGNEDLLTSAEIRPDVSGGAGQPQLLLLIGCSTADVKASFQSYPESFRDAGVSIVLAPIAPVRGEELCGSQHGSSPSGLRSGSWRRSRCLRRTAAAPAARPASRRAPGGAGFRGLWRRRLGNRRSVMLRLEMLPAACGDCLWLEYGDGAQAGIVIIDGGLRETAQVLRKRIDKARRARGVETLEVELLVVTHIDNDHIVGIIELLRVRGLFYASRTSGSTANRN